MNKAFGEDWRLRKIGNSFAFELSKIENDCDVWNLKNEDKVEIVYQPREKLKKKCEFFWIPFRRIKKKKE